jgi:hypothetical protein
MERWAPKLYEHPKYWGQCYGKPAHLVHTDTSMFAMANRLFIKTVGHVYCIGNPQQRYAWNSASRGSSVATADGAGASTPPTPAAPAAAPESSTPQPPAAVVRKWEPPLLALVAHSVAAGEKPEFRLSSMRTTVRIVGVNDDKELELQARGMRLAYTCERLSLQEKAAIAGLVADGSSARQAAVAAFFNLAAGNEAEAARWMDRAGSYAELVKKSVAR